MTPAERKALEDRIAAHERFRLMPKCPICGNKRCPKASNENFPCTNSNAPGQPGSEYQ